MLDMTKGNSNKLIIKFALPMILGNIFQQLYNLVDTIVVGRFVGPDALAAVGSSFAIVTFMVLKKMINLKKYLLPLLYLLGVLL